MFDIFPQVLEFLLTFSTIFFPYSGLKIDCFLLLMLFSPKNLLINFCTMSNKLINTSNDSFYEILHLSVLIST